MRVSRNVLSSALVLALMTTACAGGPQARQEAPKPEPVDIAGIGPRPKVFGRHAWDAAQKRAAARQAQAATKAASPAPAAQPAPVVAVTPTPPAPAPVIPAAPASPPAPAVAVAPPAAPAPVAPAPAAPVPAPQVAVATPPTTPAPAIPPRQVAAASAPAPSITISTPAPPVEKPKKADKKAPGLWARITAPPSEAPVVAGGYGPARDKDAVAAAAAFAVHESPGYVLKDIYSAKVQVVAGTNYSLCLWVRRPTLEPNPLHRRMVAATVFQGLDQHYELISWKEVETCHAGTPPQ